MQNEKKNLVQVLYSVAKSKQKIYFLNAKQEVNGISYEELVNEAKECLIKYQQQGLQAKDYVLIQVRDEKKFFITYWACLMGEMIPVLLPFINNKNEFYRLFNVWQQIQQGWLITDDAKYQQKLEQYATTINEPILEDILKKLINPFELPKCEGKLIEYKVDEQDIALILYSSGSTGEPKGAILTHESILANMRSFISALHLGKEDTSLNWLPNTHILGLIGFHFIPMFLDIDQYQMTTSLFTLNPQLWLSTVNKYRATYLATSNTGLKNFLEVYDVKVAGLEQWDLSCIRSIIIGAEPISYNICNNFCNVLKEWHLSREALAPGYGLTEMTMAVAVRQLGKNFKRYILDRNKLIVGNYIQEQDEESEETVTFVECGEVCDCCEVQITDDEEKPLADRFVGHIKVNGPCVMQGYYNSNGVITSSIDDKGWLDTQDLGFIDNKHLVIIGRQKEMIIINGVNYIPSDIEQIIKESIKNGELEHCVACGYFDEETGTEELVIFIKYDTDKLKFVELAKHIRQTVLVSLGIKLRSVVSVDTIPQTHTGKVQRFKLIENLRQGNIGKIDKCKSEELVNLDKKEKLNDITYVKEIIRQEVKKMVLISEVSDDENFFDLGIDSFRLVELHRNMQERLGIRLAVTILLDYPTINAISEEIVLDLNEKRNIVIGKKNSRTSNSAIAVVGIACRFPNGVNSPEAFWNILEGGVNPITEIPDTHWSRDGKIKNGSFLEDIDQFDPLFFGISPKEAEAMDPQQRILLEMTWEAFEDAGINPKSVGNSRTGVFVAIMQNDYAYLGKKVGKGFGAYSVTGTMPNSAAGRLSYVFNLNGPCMAIDTACSSSLVAIHQAMLQLRAGTCESAVVGGISIHADSDMQESFESLGALSDTNKCSSFDEGADGYVRGEGGAVLILKRLDDALEQQDNIWGIIRGGAVNHNGHSGGLTVPSGLAQSKVITEALIDAEVDSNEIDYIEAHGSATRLGDPQELNALGNVFGSRTETLYVGSIKSNIGHLEMASGMAGICKILVSMKYGKLPANLHFKQGNKLVDWTSLPFKVVDKTIEWPYKSGKRIAGITSLGVSGINAHLILEDRESLHNRNVSEESLEQICTISARTNNALKENIQQLIRWCDKPTTSLISLCKTLNVSRAQLGCRLAIQANSIEMLKEQLGKTVKKDVNNQEKLGKVAWLFTGQGSQYSKMAYELYKYSAAFRNQLEKLDQMFSPFINNSIIKLIYELDESLLAKHSYAQAMIFSVQVSLAAFLKALGVKPDLVIGHSIGEYAAAYVAGIMDLRTAVKMVATRGRVMDETKVSGKMVALLTDLKTTSSLIEEYKDVSIAAINAPQNVTISGGLESIKAIKKKARKAHIFAETLSVSSAFHSILMTEDSKKLKEQLQGLKFSKSQVPMISTVTGKVIDTVIDESYWEKHLVSTVNFVQAIETSTELGATVFLELGATATLCGLVAQNLQDDKYMMLPCIRKNESDYKQILTSLGWLWEKGIDIKWKEIYKDHKVERVENLPHTSYERSRVWIIDEIINEHTMGSDNLMKEEQLSSVIKNKLRELISQVTGVSKETITDELNLFALGVDSLMLVQLSKRINAQYQVMIPINVFFTTLHTINAILEYISEKNPSLLESTNQVEANKIQEDKVEVNKPQVNRTVSSKVSIPVIQNTSNRESNDLQSIFKDQLTIIKQQLALLENANFEIQDSVQLEQITNEEVAITQEEIEVKAPPTFTVKKGTDEGQLMASASRNMQFASDELTAQQQRFLDEFIIEYTQKTKKSKAYSQDNRAHLADWISSLNFSTSTKEIVYPLVSDHSKGSKFWDIDGNEYIDTAMGYGVGFFGNNATFINEAINEQIRQGFELGPQTDLVGEVTDLICELTGCERVAYCNTGSEAVMVAIRLARAVSKRDKIVRFITSFHGSFDGVLAEAEDNGSRPMDIGIPQSMVEDTMVCQYGSRETLEFVRAHGNELAAVLVEPVQSRNPSLQPKEFLQELRQICTEYGIALIFDEMITGFRIELGGAQAFFDVKADMALYGKLVAGGMPIGIVTGSSKYLDAVDGGYWSFGDESMPIVPTTFFAGTFCKHPLTMAACRAVLRRLKKEGNKLIAEANSRTARFVERINEFFMEEEVPLHAVNFGSMYRFESLVATNMPLLGLELNLLFKLMQNKGVYVWERRTCFFSVEHTDEDEQKIYDVICESVNELRQGGFEFKVLEGFTPEPSKKKNKQESRLSLSAEERRIYVLSKLKGGNEAYQICGDIHLNGEPNLALFKKTFEKIAANNEMLRCSYQIKDGELVRFIANEIEVEVIQGNLKQESREAFEKRWRKPFDLAKAPLWRLGTLIDENGENHFLFNFHHIISDGTSIDIIMNEFVESINGRELVGNKHSYCDFVYEENVNLKSSESKAKKEWWSGVLTPLPNPLNLPYKGVRPEVNDFKGDTVHFTIESDTLERVKIKAREQRITTFIYFLSTWTTFLSCLTGQEDFCIGIPWDRRNDGEYNQTVGMFAQSLALRVKPKQTQSFESYLKDVGEMCAKLYEHADYPMEELLDELKVPRNINRNPLFDTMFIYENGHMQEVKLGEVKGIVKEEKGTYTTFDVSLEMSEELGKVYCTINYSTHLFNKEQIEEWIVWYRNLINQVLDDSGIMLGKLQYLSEDQKMALLKQGQGISPNVEGITAKGLISDAFEKYCNEPAIWFENREMSFSELEERVNVLANYLVSKGARPGQVVAMLLERTPDLIATLLAIQTIGATWLPLDIAFPEERLSYMLQKSQAQYLIYSRKGTLENFRELDIVGIDIKDVQEVTNIQEVNYESKVDDIAYVIFTSGSTGKPKGTAIEQRALANFIIGMKECLEYQEKGRIACMTTASFDIFLLETVFCLAHGGCIVLGKEDEVINPEKIANLVCAGNVNYLQITPTRLQLLCTNKEASRKVLQHINTLIVGGEAFPNHLLSILQEHKNLRIFNVYGPTETCIWSACKELTHSQNVTIGLPIANTQIYILDARKQLVPNLVEGDLWIGGKGVARGYIGDVNLTNERFIENPFHEGRMYCTGDRAKWENGELVCLGRADNQVKIRGYRIELEEIEQVIKNYQGISNAAANIYELTPGNKILVAYFSSAEKGKIEIEQVKEWLRSQLPGYMVPAILMEIPKIPQTYNGKVDRNALPAPERKEEIKEDISNPIDKKLVTIWKRILGDQDIALNDNFFDIGGNSFNLVFMQVELEQEFEGIFEVTDLFSNPTIIKQRQFIESNMKNDGHIGTFNISSEWLKMDNGEEGYLQVVLEHNLNQSMQQIGNTYHLNVQGIIGALFAVCLNKVGNVNTLPVWFSDQNRELDLVSFDFTAYETLDEVFEEIHKVKHYTLANVDIVLDKCEEIRMCTVLDEKEMSNQMSDYFDIIVGIDKQQENIVFKYSSRLNKDALEQFIGQFMSLLYSMFNIKEENYE